MQNDLTAFVCRCKTDPTKYLNFSGGGRNNGANTTNWPTLFSTAQHALDMMMTSGKAWDYEVVEMNAVPVRVHTIQVAST
jgi:hypothetical protein